LSEYHYEKIRDERFAELLALLRTDDPEECSFDPWELFPAVYGSYSEDHGEAAIEALQRVLKVKEFSGPPTIGVELFMEMLCTQELAGYGMSPRTAWLESGGPQHVSIMKEWLERFIRYENERWNKPEEV
jgi:hypothetical protein